jgi:ParB family chromosome partitioning protein
MSALLSNAPQPTSVTNPVGSSRTMLSLAIEALERNNNQPRKHFDETKLEELAASIREHGIVEPILVRRDGGRYRIVAGERRWRAAQRAGLKEVPVLVRDADEKEAFELALVENIQRAELNAIEEAEAYHVLTEEHGLKQEEIATRVGKDRSSIANALRLLKLPEEVRDAVRYGRLEMGHARALLALEDGDKIKALALRAIREKLSVRATEALVRETRTKPSPRERATSSPALKDLVSRLQRRFGTRCRMLPKSATAGRIEIEYSALDELDAILAKMQA